MYTAHIKFKNSKGEIKEEDFQFELNDQDLVVVDTMLPGGLIPYFDTMMATHDSVMLVYFIQTMLLTSYGRFSKDGKSFDKSLKVKDKFFNSIPYHLLIELFLDSPKELATFLEEIVPEYITRDLKKCCEPQYEELMKDDMLDFNPTKQTIFDDLSGLGRKLKGE